MTIEILVDEPFESRISPDQLTAAIAAALAYEDAHGDVTLIICDDQAIAELNQRFLGNPDPTDVLSFPAQIENNAFVQAPGTAPYLGDVVIAYPYAASQASRENREIEDELNLLVVHGVLHLLGYDHAEPEEEAIMWARQEAILAGMQAS